MTPIITDGVNHFLAGMGVAVADTIASQITKSKEARVTEKKMFVSSLEHILDANAKTITIANEADAAAPDKSPTPERISKESYAYALHVAKARDYLAQSGLVCVDQSLYKRVVSGVKGFLTDEKINNMGWRGKLAMAAALEFGYDTLFGGTYYATVLHKSPIASWTNNIYQIPCFFGGLILGKYAGQAIKWAAKGSTERKYDKVIAELITQTDAVQFVLEYKPTDQIADQLARNGVDTYGTRLSRAGAKAIRSIAHGVSSMSTTASNAASSLMTYTRPAELTDASKDVVAERKKRFDEITRGH